MTGTLGSSGHVTGVPELRVEKLRSRPGALTYSLVQVGRRPGFRAEYWGAQQPSRMKSRLRWQQGPEVRAMQSPGHRVGMEEPRTCSVQRGAGAQAGCPRLCPPSTWTDVPVVGT